MRMNLLLLLVAGILAGCASTPTQVEGEAIQARTFNFVSVSKPYPGYVDKRAEVHKMIQDAITQNLEKRGVRRVAAEGDVTVAYLVIVGDNASTTAINTYFGYGRDLEGLRDQAHDANSGSKNPNSFAAGTLLIDVIDSKTYELLKRNHATRPLLRDITAEARGARIQEVVDEVLADLKMKG
jgi:hypothetical protein